MENVLVTGGNGLLGKYVVAALSTNYNVSIADLKGDDPRQKYGPVDVLDLPALAKYMQGQDAVIHLAAIDAAIDASPEQFFHTNVAAAWNVFHCGYEAGIRRFVLCSSTSAYGIRAATPRALPQYLPIDEAHPLQASDPYGLSKRACETVAAGFAARPGMSVAVLRPSFVAFPFEVPRMRDVFAGRGIPPTDGQWAPPVPPLGWYVAPEDAAACFARALDQERTFDIFNVAAKESFSATPTLDLLRDEFGVACAEVDQAYFGHNPHASLVSSIKARERLGWEPTIKLEALLGA